MSAAAQSVSDLILWAATGDPPRNAGWVIRWNGYAESAANQSLLKYVEHHGDRLRGKYLAWIHDLGEARIDGRQIIDHLAIDEGPSYWWLTLLVEKSPWKSPAIADAIRLLAFEEIVTERKPQRIRLVGFDARLDQVLRRLCADSDIAYRWEKTSPPPSSRMPTLVRLYRMLPMRLRAMAGLARYLADRWSLKRTPRAKWFSGDKALFVCSYFFNISPGDAASGRLESRFWGRLPELLVREGLSSNWLEFYYPHVAIPDAHTALGLARGLNRNARESGVHAFFDSWLSCRIVGKVLCGWLALNAVHFRLRHVNAAFTPSGSRLSLWPVMGDDWHASLCGLSAVNNLLWLELFDAALGSMPKQRRGLYLCENQSWEKALIAAWRKHDHGQLIAVPHSTIRFWHLSYFSDPRTLAQAQSGSLPVPDLTVLNGDAARDAFLRDGLNAGQLVAAGEALRYGDLLAGLPTRSGRGRIAGRIRVLVLGDYLAEGTDKTLRLLEQAVSRLKREVTLTIKAHPNCPVDIAAYPVLCLTPVAANLVEIAHEYDVAFASNMTSASVDAYILGLPVVIMLDESDLNFSPLRGRDGIKFVGSPAELADALQVEGPPAQGTLARAEFFYIDPEFSRWRQLLLS